eukprot:Nk52_evm1s1906 gene=Nk52_evmTU1s1906
MTVTLVEDPQTLLSAIQTAPPTKLIAIKFFAEWCGPCKQIDPFFTDLSVRNPSVLFLKVDVDKNEVAAAHQNVSKLPTFIFYKNQVKVGEVSGANKEGIEEIIRKFKGGDGDAEGAGLVPGHMNLSELVDKRQLNCLNESCDHTAVSILNEDQQFLESDCDEQLLISIPFNQPVKIHSLVFTCTDTDFAPKEILIFTNRQGSLDFGQAESEPPTQTIELTKEHLDGKTPLGLRFVKFQNCQDISIFVKSNQGDEDVTRINTLHVYGSPLSATNMNEFKRVAGEKGERH